MRIALLIAVALLACWLRRPRRRATPTPWATVNVCDTAKQPDTIGIRASMPGTPKGVRLSMRFRVQYKVDEDTWADVAGRRLRLARARRRQGRPGRVRLELHLRQAVARR